MAAKIDGMTAKRLMILLVVAVFTLGAVGVSFSGQEITGTISKIEGAQVTILDNTGEPTIVKVKDKAALADLQVGDRVLVKDGKITKMGG